MKAKGLLSVMISLPLEWDFTLAGLACISRDEIDNIVSIMVEGMSTKCEYFTISGKQCPAELVCQRYSQITYHTVQYVLECMHKCGSDIRKIPRKLTNSKK